MALFRFLNANILLYLKIGHYGDAVAKTNSHKIERHNKTIIYSLLKLALILLHQHILKLITCLQLMFIKKSQVMDPVLIILTLKSNFVGHGI